MSARRSRLTPRSRLGSGEFFGETLHRAEVGGLILVESRYAPQTRIPAHAHDDAFFYLVLDGSLTETCGSGTRFGGQGTVVYHPAGETHANHWLQAGGRCFHLELSAGWLERMRHRPHGLSAPARASGGPASWLAHKICMEARASDSAAPLAIEGLTLALVAEATRHGAPAPEPTAPRWLLTVRDMLESDLDGGYSLRELADRVEVHPTHLARTFRRHFGESLGSFVRRRRVERACVTLTTTDTPLADVALAAGFYDQSHFCRLFHRYTGHTPSAYRRLFQSR